MVFHNRYEEISMHLALPRLGIYYGAYQLPIYYASCLQELLITIEFGQWCYSFSSNVTQYTDFVSVL
jgi:hypothetical protein